MRYERSLILSCFLVIVFSLIMPAYANVLSFKTDKIFYGKSSTIVFFGTVEGDDHGELVTVVIDDPSGEFVQLIQVIPDVDSKSQKSIDISEFYTTAGTYNATAFVTTKTNGILTDFDIEKQRPVTTLSGSESGNEQENNTVTDTQTSQNTKTNEDEKTIQEKINERIEAAKKLKESQTSILNETGENIPTKPDSNNSAMEPENKQSEADLDVNENKAQTTSIVTATDVGSNLLYVVIGLGGVGAAGAVIYSMKNKSRHKTNPSSHFTFEEKNESSQKIATQSDDDYSLMILKNRLAKGEITIDEFNELKNALKEP